MSALGGLRPRVSVLCVSVLDVIMLSFLQSPEWEDFQKLEGRKTWRVDEALVIRHELPLGFNYLYCPHPESITNNQLLVIKDIAREEKSIFLKIDPLEKLQIPSSKLQIKPANSIQPRKTIAIDLQRPEEDILKSAHEKTRYNIRLAEKKGVNVLIYSTVSRPDVPELFFRLLRETAGRDKFKAHMREHYERLLSVRSENFWNELFFAEYERKIVAAAIVNFYKPALRATYLHGASSREFREIMAPHLVHWRIIQEAKKSGFKHYDMWGVDEKRWPGVTRFKKGFGGEVVEYPRSVDVVYRSMIYPLYRALRKIV